MNCAACTFEADYGTLTVPYPVDMSVHTCGVRKCDVCGGFGMVNGQMLVPNVMLGGVQCAYCKCGRVYPERLPHKWVGRCEVCTQSWIGHRPLGGGVYACPDNETTQHISTASQMTGTICAACNIVYSTIDFDDCPGITLENKHV